MKRRLFLASSAFFSFLLAKPALAAPTKAKSASTKSSAKKSLGSNAKKNSSTKTKSSKSSKSSKPTHTPSSTESGAVEPRNAISLPDDPAPQWRHYELRYQMNLRGVRGKKRVWLPLAQYKDSPWQRSFGHQWQGNFVSAGVYRDPVADMEVFYADWPDSVDEPKLEIVSQIATQNRHFDITRRGVLAERGEILRRNLQATRYMPTDGIVRSSAERALGRVKDPLAQAKALYDWVLENMSYDPQLPKRGETSIASLLDNNRLQGGSIEISLLFVGLCRAVGIPARPVFGVRIDRSRLFPSLGASGNLRQAGHCRAEVYSPGYGWIPVDPAGVLKAMHEERLSPADSRLTVLKKLLFGFWEMNWLAFNSAQDVHLRGEADNQEGAAFLLAPVVETADGRLSRAQIEALEYSLQATQKASE